MVRQRYRADAASHGRHPPQRVLQRGEAAPFPEDHHLDLGAVPAEELGVLARQDHSGEGQAGATEGARHEGALVPGL